MTKKRKVYVLLKMIYIETLYNIKYRVPQLKRREKKKNEHKILILQQIHDEVTKTVPQKNISSSRQEMHPILHSFLEKC